MKIRGNLVGTNQKPAKVMERATDLTEDQKLQTRQNIGAADANVIGDIKTALESIIAIQNNLIGGDSE